MGICAERSGRLGKQSIGKYAVRRLRQERVEILLLPRMKHVRSKDALCDVFEVFVKAQRPMQRLIGFGVFDASGTVIDQLLVVLPKAAAPLASTVRMTPATAPESVAPDNPKLPSSRCPRKGK